VQRDGTKHDTVIFISVILCRSDLLVADSGVSRETTNMTQITDKHLIKLYWAHLAMRWIRTHYCGGKNWLHMGLGLWCLTPL